MPFVLSILMSGVVSSITVMRTQGATDFIPHWTSSWALSWLVAFPTVLVVLPVVRRIVALVVEE